MLFQDRLRSLLDRDEVTAYRVWKDTAITKGTIGNYLEGKTTPNKANISLLASYFNVYDQWLLTGDGPKDKVNEEPQQQLDNHLISKDGVKYYEIGHNRYKVRAPYIAAKDYSKYLENMQSNKFLDGDFEELDFIVDEIENGRYFAFEMKGDSMDNDSRDSIQEGDIVFVREYPKEYWESRLQNNRSSFWLITYRNNVLCKKIIDFDIEKKTICCHSLNPSPEYANFELRLNDISQLCNIEQRLITVSG